MIAIGYFAAIIAVACLGFALMAYDTHRGVFPVRGWVVIFAEWIVVFAIWIVAVAGSTIQAH